jgi:UDP-N-acetylmuramoyl-L-alanyl-D-glutamate--2,6-diaminopimelate ligase
MIPDFFPVTHDSRRVGPGSVFYALRGATHDGADFIPDVLARGVRRIVRDEALPLSEERIAQIAAAGVELSFVPNPRQALAADAAVASGDAHRKLIIVGITGTKGKTTTTFLLEHLFRSSGCKTALMSTVCNKIIDTVLPAHYTTEQADYIHQFMRASVDAGVHVVIMEVAAQGLSTDRVHGIEFDGAIFTNFSEEHGEFYATHDEYFLAKCRLLDQVKKEAPIILNGDDAKVAACIEQYPRACRVSLEGYLAEFHAECMMSGLSGLLLKSENQQYEAPRLIGRFNAMNCALALAFAQSCGISVSVCKRACLSFTGVPGRLERYVHPSGAHIFIDYAHNAASFDAVLSTMRPEALRLMVLFGAGGDRDPARRPVMGALAERYADTIIITTDNPRSEDPVRIAEQIIAGIGDRSNVIIELDRARAIERACGMLEAGTIVLLLGKGPDEYQLVQGTKMPFSEREIIRRCGATLQS